MAQRQRGHAFSRARGKHPMTTLATNDQSADLLGILGVQQEQLADNGICCKIIHLQAPAVLANFASAVDVSSNSNMHYVAC